MRNFFEMRYYLLAITIIFVNCSQGGGFSGNSRNNPPAASPSPAVTNNSSSGTVSSQQGAASQDSAATGPNCSPQSVAAQLAAEKSDSGQIKDLGILSSRPVSGGLEVVRSVVPEGSLAFSEGDIIRSINGKAALDADTVKAEIFRSRCEHIVFRFIFGSNAERHCICDEGAYQEHRKELAVDSAQYNGLCMALTFGMSL